MDPWTWLWLKKVKCWTCCSCSDKLSAIHQSNGAAQMLLNILQPREHQEAWMTQFTCFTYCSSGEFKLLIWIQTFQLNSSIKWNIFYCSTLNLQPSVILQMDVGRQPAAVSMSWISSVLTYYFWQMTDSHSLNHDQNGQLKTIHQSNKLKCISMVITQIDSKSAV